jgi:tripartite-type tricarboxylate transporter receptor subunit TctC
MFLPAQTPRDIVEKLHGETLKVLGDAKVKEKLSALGVDPLIMTPAEFASYVDKEIAVNAALVKAAGIKPE